MFYAWRPNLPDEADKHLIELAVAAQADAIVTRNLRDVSRVACRVEISPAQGPCARAMPGGISKSTLTIRLPDDKHERLKALARANAISVDDPVDELATVALANFDARVRFETRAAGGSPDRALALLALLDKRDVAV